MSSIAGGPSRGVYACVQGGAFFFRCSVQKLCCESIFHCFFSGFLSSSAENNTVAFHATLSHARDTPGSAGASRFRSPTRSVTYCALTAMAFVQLPRSVKTRPQPQYRPPGQAYQRAMRSYNGTFVSYSIVRNLIENGNWTYDSLHGETKTSHACAWKKYVPSIRKFTTIDIFAIPCL